jgi:predicted acetyltransferase
LEVRGYRTGDGASLARLAAGAFGENGGYWERYYEPGGNSRVDLNLVHLIVENGEARASATVLPLEVFVDGRPVPMGGIAAVATDPAYRRRGFAGALMRAVLRTMRERGIHLSMLHPFAHAFYRAYGWELATEAIAYTLKPTDLPTSSEQRRVRAYREDDLPKIIGLLEEEVARLSCCVRRGEGRWRDLLGRKDWEVAVYEREGHLEGYILYRMSDWREDREPRRTLAVQELVWGSVRAREALISFLAAQDPLVFEIKHNTPRGEPLHPYLRNSYVKAEIEPEFMLRLVDVEAALKLLNRTASEPLVLEVSDDVVPENAGEYTVGEKVVRGAETGKRVSLDVRQLAQLYAGYLPAGQLARHGLVEPRSPGALGLLGELFPPGEPWIYPPDHF